MKAVYTSNFHTNGYSGFGRGPDLEILTEGKDLQDAIEMARDAIGLTGISMQDNWGKHSRTI